MLASEREEKGPGADLIKLEEEGIESSLRMKETYIKKTRGGQRAGGKA